MKNQRDLIYKEFKNNTIIIDEHVLINYIDFCIENNDNNIVDGENHHILPRSLFIDYIDFSLFPENKTRLSYSNHLKAHYLLALSINSDELVYAFNMMNNFYNKNNLLNLEKYDKLKSDFKKLVRKFKTGQKWMFKNGIYLSVKHDNVDSHLNDGWIFQAHAKNSIWVNNDIVSKRVDRTDIEYENWNIGRLDTKSKNNTIWMNNGTTSTRIHYNEIDDYIKLGWIKGEHHHSTKNYVRISKNNINSTVKKEQLQKFLDDGWKIGAYKVYCSYCNKELSSLGKHNHKCKGKYHEYTFYTK